MQGFRTAPCYAACRRLFSKAAAASAASSAPSTAPPPPPEAGGVGAGVGTGVGGEGGGGAVVGGPVVGGDAGAGSTMLTLAVAELFAPPCSQPRWEVDDSMEAVPTPWSALALNVTVDRSPGAMRAATHWNTEVVPTRLQLTGPVLLSIAAASPL